MSIILVLQRGVRLCNRFRFFSAPFTRPFTRSFIRSFTRLLCVSSLLLGLWYQVWQPANAQAPLTDTTSGQQPADVAAPHAIYLPYVSANEQASPTTTPPTTTPPTTMSSSDSTYGAATVGESLEKPCVTKATVPTALVLSPADDWQSALTQAGPSATILLHGGTYQSTDKLWIPNGQPNRLITIQPYNCEAVTLYTSLRPGSYNVIAGLHIEAVGISDTTWAIRIDGKNKGPIRQVVIRNNTILGGDKDAVKVSADVVGATITGNHIDGGKASHDLNVQSEGTATAPDQIVISNNLLTKHYFNSVSEDMLQVIDALNIEFSHNTCADGPAMEQCVDIKETRAPLNIHNNIFDGGSLHTVGDGVDGSAGCMVIHEHNKQPENHLIDHNLFRNCRDTVIRFASEGGNALARATVRNNIFISPDSTDLDGLLIWRAQDVDFENNTMIRGDLKLGVAGDATRTPVNTTLKNNLFYQTRIDDRTTPPTSTYQCSYNLSFQITGNVGQANCQNSQWNADPLLPDIAHEQLKPASNSPACEGGENGVTQGALPCL